MTAEEERHQAEIRRLEAERAKLELEAREIERRLKARWWHDQRLPQYLLAIVITAALLFGWTRAYLEPILTLKSEIHKLTEERDKLISDALKEQSAKLERENKQLAVEREELTVASRKLETKIEEMKLITAGLRIAVENAANGKSKFFSILNQGDPINQLANFGWRMSSDNYFGQLGYYLVLSHPKVRDGKPIIVGRIFEVEDMQNKHPDSWRDDIAKINAAEGPVLVLDYSYLALLADENAAIGGTVYGDGRETEFYVPLASWADKFAALFPN